MSTVDRVFYRGEKLINNHQPIRTKQRMTMRWRLIVDFIEVKYGHQLQNPSGPRHEDTLKRT